MATPYILFDIAQVLQEDPKPTESTVRIVMDPHLRIPLRSYLVKTATQFRTIVVAEYTAHNTPKLQSLEQARVEIWFCKNSEEFNSRLAQEFI